MAHSKKKKNKVQKVLHEFKRGTLKSGSKKGPTVTSRKQAIAIALSEARKSGEPATPPLKPTNKKGKKEKRWPKGQRKKYVSPKAKA